jgi:hypothetical protein
METFSGWERAKRVVDLVAGLSVIATMVFIALQWNEMHSGATDTHDLAIAAKSQADAAKSQADNTKIIAESAKAQAENTRNLALAATDQVTKLAAGVRESHALVKATQDTLSELRMNFAKDQRPYMWAKAMQPRFEENKPLLWDVHFINYGKSPAVHVVNCVVLFYGLNIVPEMTPAYRDTKCAETMTRTEAIAPPGDNIFTTASSNAVLTLDAIKVLKDTDYKIGLMGKITYEDTAGNKYVSTFCNLYFASGGVPGCEKYNEIK